MITIEVRPKSKIHPASDLLQENLGIIYYSQIFTDQTFFHKHSLVRDWKNAVSSFFIQCLQLHQFAEFRWNVATQKIVGEDSVMTKQLRSRQKKSDYEAIIMVLPSCTIMTLSIFRPLQENVVGKLCGFVHYNVQCVVFTVAYITL
jgi:hypothetical protein